MFRFRTCQRGCEHSKTKFGAWTVGERLISRSNGGNLEKTVINANRSVDAKLKSDRDCTCFELGRLMKKLEFIRKVTLLSNKKVIYEV